MSRFCENCGAPLDDDALFCENCGAKVGGGAHMGFRGQEASGPPLTQSHPQSGVQPYQQTEAQPYQQTEAQPYQQSGVSPYQQSGVSPYPQSEAQPYQQTEAQPYQQVGAQPYQETGAQPYQQTQYGMNQYTPQGWGETRQEMSQPPQYSYPQSSQPPYPQSPQPPSQYPFQQSYSQSSQQSYSQSSQQSPQQVYTQSPRPKRKSALPILLGAAALVLIIVVGFNVIGKGTWGKKSSGENGAKTEGIASFGKSDDASGISEADPLSAAMGMISAQSAENLKIPEGAFIKTDAGYYDLIGEYEGEIQMTRFDGFESLEEEGDIPPEAIQRIKDTTEKVLSEPVPCSFEIEEDGDWEIKFDIMNGMDFRSSDYRNDPGLSDVQKANLLLKAPVNGVYSMGIEAEEDLEEEGTTVKMVIRHVGAYCTEGAERLIVGNHAMNMFIFGKEVNVAGDFIVYKTTDDIVPEGGAETAAVQEEAVQEAAIREAANQEAGEYAGNDMPIPDENDQMSPSAAGPAAYAIRGGEWEQLQDGTYMYLNENGINVENTWVEDGGKYYYIGPDGAMVRDNYSTDGYWVGSDGSWDDEWPQRNDDPEPLSGKYVGFVQTWDVDITKDGNYGTATFTYTEFGGRPEVYDLMPAGHGVYIAQSRTEPSFKALMSVNENGMALTVSQAGTTETCIAQ